MPYVGNSIAIVLKYFLLDPKSVVKNYIFKISSCFVQLFLEFRKSNKQFAILNMNMKLSIGILHLYTVIKKSHTYHYVREN